MKKLILLIFSVFFISLFISCKNNNDITTKEKNNVTIVNITSKKNVTTTNAETTTNINNTIQETQEEVHEFMMKIDGIKINISWEENDSVKELKEFASNGLTINMHQYGGFEQVGSIGKNITSNNIQLNTNPGDVVLYASNQIVIFFGHNSWSYTKLGHINLTEDELNNLLNKENVELYLGE